MLKLIIGLMLLASSHVYAAELSWQDKLSWQNIQKNWQDDVQFHGFLSQGLISSSGNNVYGHSKNSVSALTEVGLNASYQYSSQISFAIQGLYRRAGSTTGKNGIGVLDYAFMDYRFFNDNQWQVGIRGGRIKNPWGLYNETRDVSFTRPTMFMPLPYYERSRGLVLAMNGGQVYVNQFTSWGDLYFKFNLGVTESDQELLIAVTSNPAISGKLNTSGVNFLTQLRYEILEGQYVFAVSYAQMDFEYKGLSPIYNNLQVPIRPLMLSMQYNGERFSLAAEYNLQWNHFYGALVPEIKNVSEGWYIQGGYKILDNLEATIRYDQTARDKDDPLGKKISALSGGLMPAYYLFTHDTTISLRWDVTPEWMLRAEYHRVHGASNISMIDNPDIGDIAEHWNIYALQVAFRF